MTKFTNEDDIGQSLWLSPNDTGIPTSIIISDAGTSLGAGIYFYDNIQSEFQGDYQNIKDISELNNLNNIQNLTAIEISQIKQWLNLNTDAIKNVLSGLFSEVKFVFNMKKIRKSESKIKIDSDILAILNESKINEMTTLYPYQTNLPTIIYISKRQGSHSARIKFLDVKTPDKVGNRQNDWISITISDNPELDKHARNPKYIKGKDLEQIKQWIITHKEALEKLWNDDTISIIEVYNMLGIKE